MRRSPLVLPALLLLSACGTPSLPTMSGHDHGQMMQPGNDVGKYLPSDTIDAATVPMAKDSSVLTVANGETIELSPMVVKKKINGK